MDRLHLVRCLCRGQRRLRCLVRLACSNAGQHSALRLVACPVACATLMQLLLLSCCLLPERVACLGAHHEQALLQPEWASAISAHSV